MQNLFGKVVYSCKWSALSRSEIKIGKSFMVSFWKIFLWEIFSFSENRYKIFNKNNSDEYFFMKFGHNL